MSDSILGVMGITVLLILIFIGMPVGISMMVAGFLGYVVIGGLDSALYQLGSIPFTQIANPNLTMIPLFMLMAMVAVEARISGDLYTSAYTWIGRLKGGLAMSTIVACGIFGAIASNGLAGAIAIGKVAYPNMERYNYRKSLAASSISAGSSIADLIPPSTTFIFYGLLTNQSIGELFMAGFLPGMIQIVLFMSIVFVLCRINPKLGPAGPQTTLKEKLASIKLTGPVTAIFILCIGGIYFGVFTPTEAGGIGAFGAFIIGFVMGRLKRSSIISAFLEAGRLSGMIGILLCGAMIFSTFITVTNLPFDLADIITGLEVNRYMILVVILMFYIIAGCFLDIGSIIILTVPIFFPLIRSLGFDPIWYGVLIVIAAQLGVITPPLGMLVFALSAVIRVPVGTIFRGIVPFVMADILLIAMIIFFPKIALLIPNAMKSVG